MPFTSKRQQRAAFGGHIPGISKAKAREWAHETPNLKELPDRAPAEKGKPTLLSKESQLAHAHESAKGIAPSQLRAGEKVELEHTKSRAAAKQIAIDHLRERPDYYGLLEELEKKPLTSKRASFKLDGERKFRGLDIAIENAKGSTRKWHDPFGKETGSTFMHYPYGYIRLTKGTDGDHVDVYIGPDEDAENVFVIDQMKKPDFKTFDEQKVMLGFKSAADAKAAYLKQYNDPGFFGSMKSMPFEEFKMKVLSKKNFGEKIAKAWHGQETPEDKWLGGLVEEHAQSMKPGEHRRVKGTHAGYVHDIHLHKTEKGKMFAHPLDSVKIAFAVTPGMLSGLQHAGVGAGIGALAGGVGGAMHASPEHRGRGILHGALVGAGLGAAGGAGISAIKGHGAQQLATLRGSAQEAEQAALAAHQNVKNIQAGGWGSEIAHAAPPRVSTTAATQAATPAAGAVERGTLAARPGVRPASEGGTVAARVRPQQPKSSVPADPALSTQAQAVMDPRAHGYAPTQTPHGPGIVQGQEGAYRRLQGAPPPGNTPAPTGTVAPAGGGAPSPRFSSNYDLAQQQAAAAGSRAAGLGLAANTLEQQQQVMNKAINRAGLVGAAAGTGLMGYMAVPNEYGGVSRQQPQPMKLAFTEETQGQLETGAGLGALAGGGVAISKAKPLITGRTTLYHGTTPELAEKIRQQGLLPSAQVSGPAITDILSPDIKEQAKKLVYLTPDVGEARGYAGQAEALSKLGPHINYQAPDVAQARALGTVKGRLNPFHKGVVKAELPMWQKHIADAVKANPEARGDFGTFKSHIVKTIKDQGGFLPHEMLPEDHFLRKYMENNFESQLKAMHESLSRAVAVEGGVAPEFIRGSDKFKSVGLRELKDYALMHPGRMAAGVGLVGAGLGAGVLGAKALGSGIGRLRAARADQGKQASDGQAESTTADRLDDLGIGILASPYIADLAAAGGKKLMLRGGRLGALGAELHGAAEGVGHVLHSPAVELGGLALVAPGVTHTLARGIDKLRGIPPQEPPSAAPPTPAQLTAEKVGRLLAHSTKGGQEKVAINLGGTAVRGLRAGANFMWQNRKPIAGLAAVGAVGAGLYGGKKVIDTAKDMATEHHEPARYVGVPPGMRPPTSV